MSAIEVKPISGGVGVELANVDIGGGLSDVAFADIQQNFIEHGLVFIHGQDLSPEQHIEFAERFGEINVNRFFPKVAGYEKIAAVTKEKDQKANIGGGWHTDHSYDQIPALGSILLARETPPVGGDTLFACMYKAYDSLSPGLKRTLEGMKAVHSSRHIFGDQSAYRDELDGVLENAEQATQDAVHPVIITHPESGKKRFTSIRLSPCISTAGRRPRASRYWIICINTRRRWSIRRALNGPRGRSPFGIIAAPGIMR
jgi:taurine dioxygenase